MGDCNRRLKVYEIGKFDVPIMDIDMVDTWALCLNFYQNYILVGTDHHKVRVYDLNFKLLDEVEGHKDGVCL